MLEVKNVSLQFGGRVLFKNVDVAFTSGNCYGIIGANGAGKSTLLKLMAGLLQPDAGTVSIDGTDIRRVGIRQYRDVCAGILQTDQLLSGSLLDNITLFDLEVDMANVERACQQACIHDLIMALPMKYHSLVGDMGSNLSAGQAQRILLARAFYKQAKILFLDEATANLDIRTETEILKTIKSLGATLVMISHRPEIVALADMQLDLHRNCGGRIAK